MEINLISDTVTKPTNEMLQYMFNAEVEMMSIGKTNSYNRGKQRTIRYGSRSVFRLNNGKSNGYKSKYTTRRAIIADKYAHVYHYEVEESFNSGVSCCLLDGNAV
jgi:threonine aldolase